MSIDIATLGVAINTGDVATGVRELDKLTAAGGRAEAATKRLGTGVAAAGKQMGVTAHQAQQISFQLNDFFVQIASGQSPLTALIQQGSQLSGTFGGIGAAARAVGSTLLGFINPVTLAGAAAAGLGALWLISAKDADEFAKRLALTGNIAGQTADSYRITAQQVEKTTRVTIGTAKELVSGVISSGAFGPQAVGVVSEAMARVQKLSGQTSEEVVKQFSSMSKGVSQWAAEANRSYNFLTAEQFKHIQRLQAEGRTQEAMTETARLLNDELGNRMPKSLNTLDEALDKAAGLWSKFWNAAKGTFDVETLAQQIERLENAFSIANTKGGGPITDASRDKRLPGIGAELFGSYQAQRFADESAKVAAETAAKNAKEIEELSSGHQSALAAIANAGAQRMLAQQQAALDAQQSAQDLAFQHAELTARQYSRALMEIDRDRIDAEEQAVRSQIGAERGRATSSPAEALSQQASVTRLLTQLDQLDAKRQQLYADIVSGKYDITPRSVDIGPSGALNAFKGIDYASVDADTKQAKDARQSAAHDLVEINKQLSVSLIAGDLERGQAEIAIEEESMRKRLDIASLNAEDRKRVEEDFAKWRELREQQLKQPFVEDLSGAISESIFNGFRNADSIVDVFRRLMIRRFAETVLQPIISPITASGGGLDWLKIIGGIAGLFGGGGSVNGVQGDTINSPQAGFAVGTNYVPRDMVVQVHEGEAVIPKAYNPAAGGKSAGASITYAPVVNIDSRTDQAQIGRLVAEVNQRGNQQLVEMLHARGVF